MRSDALSEGSRYKVIKDRKMDLLSSFDGVSEVADEGLLLHIYDVLDPRKLGDQSNEQSRQHTADRTL
jgi:hypothetical protein